MKQKQYLYMALFFTLFVSLAISCYVIMIFQIRGIDEKMTLVMENIDDLEMKITEMNANIDDMKIHMDENYRGIRGTVQEAFSGIVNAVHLSRRDVSRLESTYASILKEQKKRTVNDLHKEKVINDKIAKGIELYRNKEYSESYSVLQSVSNQLRGNKDAQYCIAASLFHMNQMNSSKYPEIKNMLSELKESGYVSDEMDSILEFIQSEETAME